MSDYLPVCPSKTLVHAVSAQLLARRRGEEIFLGFEFKITVVTANILRKIGTGTKY